MSNDLPGLVVRRATEDDIDTVTDVIALAFEHDPLWAPALAGPTGRTDHVRALWHIFVEGAVATDWVSLVDGGAAVSLWIPPGGSELTPDGEARLEALIDEHLGPKATVFRELMARFEAHHPRRESHFYLSLLGTHPAHRGRGIGMRLLARDLELIDAQRAAAYLESSNPANDERYRRLGFEPVGSFDSPGGEATVTTMWRSAS